MFGLPYRDLKPVAFHPYTSRVLDRIFECDCGSSEDMARAYQRFEKALLKKFNEEGIKATIDNKIVFEMSDGQRIFCFGFYDWKFSIGFTYDDENERNYKRNLRNSPSYW